MNDVAAMVIRHARIATMLGVQAEPGDGPLALLEDGALVVADGKIAWLGPDAQLPRAYADIALQLDAQGMMLAPGLIDPHTHLLFAGDRSGEHAQRLAGASYLEIAQRGGGIRATVRAVRAASDEQLVLSMQERLARLLLGGVTTVEVKSGYGLSVAEELRMLRLIRAAAMGAGCDVVPTLLGLHAVPEGIAREDWIRAVIEELTPEAARTGLARGCDAFCETGAFTQEECAAALEAGARVSLVPHLHADQLSAGGGAQLAARLNCASADHLERTDLAGAEAMARADCTAVLLPLAAWTLREKTPAQAPLFLRAGATVALASNINPGTQRIEGVSMLLASACLLAGFTPAQALYACTRGAARALRLDDRGRLEVGLRADLVLFAAEGADHLAWHAGVEHARVVIREGRIVLDRRDEPALRCLA